MMAMILIIRQPRELEVDHRTGMKNYIANEGQGWDTSKTLVRRLIERCVHVGRQYRANGRKEDEYEAYRLLGTLLHTLEDFPAHSNFTELALVMFGHRDVFVHMGDAVRIQAPGGKMVAPLVTGDVLALLYESLTDSQIRYIRWLGLHAQLTRRYVGSGTRWNVLLTCFRRGK
jgi:hypothetical protein